MLNKRKFFFAKKLTEVQYKKGLRAFPRNLYIYPIDGLADKKAAYEVHYHMF